MSVIVAIKENGVVYTGADSQTSLGKRKHKYLNEVGYKVHRLDNGMLLGFCGRVASRQAILAMKEIFTLDENGRLTKEHIVKNILPELQDRIGEIAGEECASIEVSILLIYKDEMYQIFSDLRVIHLNENATIGAGASYANYALFNMTHLPVRQRIVKALVESSKRCDSVEGPFVLIDTKNLEYEVIDKE